MTGPTGGNQECPDDPKNIKQVLCAMVLLSAWNESMHTYFSFLYVTTESAHGNADMQQSAAQAEVSGPGFEKTGPAKGMGATAPTRALALERACDEVSSSESKRLQATARADARCAVTVQVTSV